jgi:hypothetical protein
MGYGPVTIWCFARHLASVGGPGRRRILPLGRFEAFIRTA